ncbi:uncharacterized protein B0I36DRAFT_106720 [Microdochium trichocladiopsis]|uniref:Uncharacterized protein n=1 Tax=Microdochium trichocladiopsis TaxID=1682393 RepID=A0A9P8Y8R9_9PEZI|nr:uncharacterized protein B0I36DRAFT_106720 [Microdochium trichocladiopsis]KAH7033259.1 hypothetical protein B0I36DRAFT_106720 [Microdochium trichocladiopsis]
MTRGCMPLPSMCGEDDTRMPPLQPSGGLKAHYHIPRRWWVESRNSSSDHQSSPIRTCRHEHWTSTGPRASETRQGDVILLSAVGGARQLTSRRHRRPCRESARDLSVRGWPASHRSSSSEQIAELATDAIRAGLHDSSRHSPRWPGTSGRGTARH